MAQPEEHIVGNININLLADRSQLSDTDISHLISEEPRRIKTPFFARIENIIENEIILNQSWNEFKTKLNPKVKLPGSAEFSEDPSNKQSTDMFNDWTITFKSNDKRDLRTYLYFNDDVMLLTTNVKTDIETFPHLPYSAIYKLYEPLPIDVEERDKVFIVKEILPELTQTVQLVPYDQEDEDVLVLKVPDSIHTSSPITKRSTEFQNYDTLVTTDARLKQEIEDKYLTKGDDPVELSIDYSNYDNYINFSSVQKRLENFKYKIELIEEYTAKSSSLVSITNSGADLLLYDGKIRDVKNNFDGYEKYLYNTKSTYATSSMGEFPDASWPKTGSGSYADPYKPLSSSNQSFIDWYGSLISKTGQIYSASLYDTNNPNRLVNLLPLHVTEDNRNKQFFDLIDMVGHQFDELWLYTKDISNITDRQHKLTDGFSKDLVFNLVNSLGWNIQDGKDLLDLSRAGFGQKLSGDTYSLYTSGSIDSPPEGDISKEITKRIISSMPYLLKSKGTLGSLRGLLNCYGIPSSILRVREYGGDQSSNQRVSFEITRKFTKALGFRGSQYIETTWVDDTNSGRKPETVEFRFRAASGSDQVLVQKDTNWVIKLKDNGSTDNLGTVAFILSGSDGLHEVSSSLLPIYDGEYHSVMLRKSKVENNLFPNSSFETSSLFNPPFDGSSTSARNGTIEIVSGSNVSKVGSNSLKHINTSKNATSYTLFFKNPNPRTIESNASASIVSVSDGETYTFSAFAKVSASVVDSVARLGLFELDSNEQMVNWDLDNSYENAVGGMKIGETVGLNEKEWKLVEVTKTINFPNTKNLGIRFENVKPDSTIYWDEVSVRKVSTTTDDISNAFNYDLYVKKFDAGIDRIIHSSKTTLSVTGSTAINESLNASWTGSGNLFIGGNSTTNFSATKLSGSIMEFRLWTEPLEEQYFNVHTEAPKSYIGNTPSSSYHTLVRRYSFDDNTTLSDGSSIRDVSANQTYTQTGSAQGFGGLNTFESVVDRSKTIVPNHGPNRRNASKIRIENNVLSGSGVGLSRYHRHDKSSARIAPLDSPKVGIYFSPVDVINEDIMLSFANLDFNQYLGDPRDVFSEQYSELKSISNQYFQKYSGRNDFWDYMRLIKYYDQSVFKQMQKLIPSRSKPRTGVLIEGNVFERQKSPIQRNNPTFEHLYYDKTINVTNFDVENEDSRSIVSIASEYPNHEGVVSTEKRFRLPALYNFSANDNYSDRNLYISGSVTLGGPDRVFSEATGAMILNNRISVFNKEYKFFYTSSADFDNSLKKSLDNFEHLYSSKSLHETDLDPEYQFVTAFNNTFYAGVKNSIDTTIDGKYPIQIRLMSTTVATPTDSALTNLIVTDDTL
jgi:hypothetical protein